MNPISNNNSPDMPGDIVLSVKHVSKKFCSNLKRSMLYGMRNLAKDMFTSRIQVGSQSGETSSLGKDEFWALRDISFDIRKGECLGLIGDNGSGKTTLLRLITGIFPPDSGEIARRGRLGALIALGAGFHPHMTGRENIYLNGTILGMSRDEIEDKMINIIDFAEIGEFIDAPVSTYSSGMSVRLGFAIAVHTDPELLLVDEILAVGDYNFQEKCMQKMDEIRASDKAVVLVTHSLFRIESLCDRAVWLSHGECVLQDSALTVVRRYLDLQEVRIKEEAQRKQISIKQPATPASPLTIDRVELVGKDGTVKDEFQFGADFAIRCNYTAHKKLENPLFNIRIFHKGHDIFEASMLIDGYGPKVVEGEGVVECHFVNLPLTPKVYDIVIFVRTSNGAGDLCPMRTYATFRITDEALDQIPLEGPYAVNHLRQGSPVYVPREWKFYKNGQMTDTLKSDWSSVS